MTPAPDSPGAGRPDILISASKIHKRFGRSEVLKGVSLDVGKGEVVSVLGRSGGGKSTLLRCLNLLERPTSGRIQVLGRSVFDDGIAISGRQLVDLRRRFGMVFQNYHIFPHLTAAENIVMPLVQGTEVGEDEAVDRALESLSMVGLTHRALALPSTMSGGEQQRVAIARALALRPEALLFDEPTSALDPESTRDVLRVMARLSQEGMTMAVVTHEIAFARQASNRVLFVDSGLVEEEGPPENVIDDPQSPRTRAFLAGMQGVT